VKKTFVVSSTAKGDLRDILLDLAEDSPDAAVISIVHGARDLATFLTLREGID